MDNLSFEQKIAMLIHADPKKKIDLIHRWRREPEFYYGVNMKQLPMSEVMKQEKWKNTAQYARDLSKNQINRGWNRSKSARHIAEIPADIWFSRPEFSPNLPKKVLKQNVEKFLREYPQFRVDK